MKTEQAIQKIQELRQQGYRVFVNHYRPSISEKDICVNPKGGRTVVQILKGDTVLAEGESYCAPIDNYNKTLGKCIALGRCLCKLNNN